ncbi:MAG: N-acetylmuramoyl-L-alanine amidase family protein [Burkholderiales bacterium]
MSKQKPQENSKNGRNGQKKRYRFNAKKFATTMSVLCFIVAGAIIAAHYIGESGGIGAIAALDNPQRTAKAGAQASGEAAKGLAGKSVVVDAGHGGFDPGTIGSNGAEEDDVNLAVSKFLKAELEDRGAKVIMTRSDENAIADTKDADMEKRRVIIRDSGSDIVVSVHMNSFKDESVSGPLVLFMTGSAKGKALAECIQQRLNDELGPESKGAARSENLHVLRAGSQPSVLVECGFLSNPEEEKKLLTEDYQKKVAKAICNGIEDYFGNQ